VGGTHTYAYTNWVQLLHVGTAGSRHTHTHTHTLRGHALSMYVLMRRKKERKRERDRENVCVCVCVCVCVFACHRLGHRVQRDEHAPKRVEEFQRRLSISPDALVAAGSTSTFVVATVGEWGTHMHTYGNSV
jgi:hypothetical protein